MSTVHMRLGVALVAVVVIGALWALVEALRGDVSPSLRVFARLSALALVVQVVLGLLLLAAGHRPADGLHYVYGGVVLLCIPAGIAYGGGGSVRREAWALCIGLGAAVLLAARAVATGG
jgi:asparagine N-glycosylation enzyme membrane subunit Stt3